MNNTNINSLHICNIANVAYGCCKILDQNNFGIKLICHDMKHLMSQPEWDDLELNPEDFPDENDFYNNTAKLNGYTRPNWFISEELASFRPPIARALAPISRSLLPHRLHKKAQNLFTLTQSLYNSARKRLHCILKINHSANDQGRRLHSSEKYFCSADIDAYLRRRSQVLSEKSREYGDEWVLKESDFLPYFAHAKWLNSHIGKHDLINAYVLSPIYAMLMGTHPYVSIEIGTMREIPFDGTVTGKLLALAYRLSDYVLITNPDVKKQAEELGLERYTFCPHPLDEDVYCPVAGENELRIKILSECDADFILLAPARQNWFYKANDRMIHAFAALVRSGVKAILVVPAWGQDIEQSKKLACDLGVNTRIKWIKPLSERLLIKYMQASDVVLDQFKLGVFGLLSPKALSCGKPLLTSYNPNVHRWCFDEHPPIVQCQEIEVIFHELLRLAKNPQERLRIGAESRDWVVRNHSKRHLQKIMLNAMINAKEHFKNEKNM